MTLRFSDGMEINTEGEYRIISKNDGLYVVGHGFLCPIEDEEEGRTLLRRLTPIREYEKSEIDTEFNTKVAAFYAAASSLLETMEKDHTGEYFSAGYPFDHCFREIVYEIGAWKETHCGGD